MKKCLLLFILIVLSISGLKAQWSAVGTGVRHAPLGTVEITRLVVYNGKIYAGGNFDTAGSISAKYIANWNGTVWDSVGSGFGGGDLSPEVHALGVYNSELYAGGEFTIAGGDPAHHAAIWNGTWSEMGGGTSEGSTYQCPYAFVVYNGELYVGGTFTIAGTTTVNYIAKWNGTSWLTVGNGMTGGGIGSHGVYSLAIYNGELYAGGQFVAAGGVSANNIAKWNGTSWSALGSGIEGSNVYVLALAVYNGELYAGGEFSTAGGNSANHIAKWNGTSWSAVGTGMNGNRVKALEVYDDDLYAGGSFTTAGGVPANRIAKWDGTAWSAVGSGTSGSVNALAVYNSELYVGGTFNTAGGISVNKIAKWIICSVAPQQPGSITGNTSVCEGSSQTYSISGVSGAATYTWTLPSGWTGSSTTTSITATVGANGGNISVTAENDCGSSPAQTLAVTVNSLPLQPGSITGSNSVCQGTSQTYSISAVSGATSYTWTLPAGWSGSSTTTSITTTVGANSGSVSVTANNTCGSSPAQTLSVTVTLVPAQPGAINGNNSVCPGSSQTYFISAVSGAASYTWTLPAGWTGSSNTNSITATVGTNGGTVSVTANNTCGSSTAQNLTVTLNTIPAQPGTINGSNAVCQSSSQTYTITAVNGATSYTWTLPAGWSGSSITTNITTTVGDNSGNISVTANNTCGSSTAQTMAVTVSPFPAQPGEISGSNTTCQGSMQTYSIDEVGGATSYSWTLPSGWTGTSTTNSISAIVGVNSGNVSVIADNSCGSSSAQTLAVTVSPVPAQPGTITGSNSVCQGSSQIFSINPVSGATSYTWILPSGWTGVSTTESITATVGANGGNIVVMANNSCGTSTPQTLAVTVNPVPAQPGSISGNNAVCQGSAQTYSIAEVSGATSYTWTLPSGWNGSSNTTSITSTVGANSDTISVTANNSCGSSTIQTLAVTINSAPAQPDTINGNTFVCPASTQTYTISPVGGAESYSWTLPSGWTGSSTTDSISITVGASGGTISVIANNNCGISVAQTLEVIVVNSAPSQPGPISGGNTVCQGSLQTYSIEEVSGASSYTWTIPTGWTGVSTTTSIITTVGANGGNISVIANNGCGSSPAQALTVSVNPVPIQPSAISGNNILCVGSAQTYSIDEVSGASSYTWVLPPGWTGSSTTTSITATTGNSSGNISVAANNNCGGGTAQTIAVTVDSIPAKPGAIAGNTSVNVGQEVIYSIEDVPGASGYSWLLSGGGNIASGQNTTSITVNWEEAGNDTLSVAASNHCGTGGQQKLFITVSVASGINNADDQFAIQVMPNPFQDLIYLKAEGVMNKVIAIEIFNLSGQTIYRNRLMAETNDFSQVLNLEHVAAGLYEVEIYIDGKNYGRTIARLD